MIDWQRVSQLRDEVGEEDFTEVAELFLDEVADGLADLDPASGLEAVQAQLHNLKGSALNLGFSEFASLCALFEDPEKAAALGPPEHQQLLDSFTASKASFETEIGSDAA